MYEAFAFSNKSVYTQKNSLQLRFKKVGFVLCQFTCLLLIISLLNNMKLSKSLQCFSCSCLFLLQRENLPKNLSIILTFCIAEILLSNYYLQNSYKNFDLKLLILSTAHRKSSGVLCKVQPLVSCCLRIKMVTVYLLNESVALNSLILQKSVCIVVHNAFHVMVLANFY